METIKPFVQHLPTGLLLALECISCMLVVGAMFSALWMWDDYTTKLGEKHGIFKDDNDFFHEE